MFKKILALMIFTVTICLSSQSFVYAENSASNTKVSDAVELIRQGNYNGAINVLTEAVELNPSDAVAYNLRGLAYFKLQNWEPMKKSL